ncbi:MAG: hypothetical protein EKK48_15220 [Candidatus Melainabacteria bacterium]|nr:MAG: hypothetical protein EKK48_15220 [Candidatus Melainabacteria bacterium]
MAKVDLIDLRERIGRDEFDHLLISSALSPYQAVRQKINQLLKSGNILRVKKGLYVFGPKLRRNPVCKETLANLIYGPSCISLEYALSLTGFIPERVEVVTSVTPKKNKTFDTPIGRFTYRYLSAAKYPHGIEQIWVDSAHPVLIATPEKALCDYVVLNDVPNIDSPDSAREFLVADLRIDPTQLERFDIRRLTHLNKHYKSASIARILEVL